MMEVDVIIPVYKPTEKLTELLERLGGQTMPVHRLILVNTEKKYFDEFTAGKDLGQKYKNLTVTHIKKKDFDHGRTRNFGVSLSKSPYFILMTDDAVPVDEGMVERLMAPFADIKIGMSYARQVPSRECGVIERYTRSFNYPQKPCVKSAGDLKSMGIKAFFASNVCAAYRRDIFDELNGFTGHTIFNEDMIYARSLINAGYKIAYAAKAEVIHSHNYTGLQQLRRNFDLGVSHAEYPEVFSGLSTESEGIRLVKETCRYLCKIGKPWLVCKLVWQSGCKYLGYFLGKRYKHLGAGARKRLSMNKEYWDQCS